MQWLCFRPWQEWSQTRLRESRCTRNPLISRHRTQHCKHAMESIRNPFKVLGASEEITMRNPWGKLHTVLDKQDQQTKRRESNTTKQLSEQIWRINTFSAFLRWREWQVPSKVPWGAQWQHDCLHKQSILKKHLQKSWLFLSEVSSCSFSGTPPNMQAHGLHRCCRRAKDWPCDWTLNELGSDIVATL